MTETLPDQDAQLETKHNKEALREPSVIYGDTLAPFIDTDSLSAREDFQHIGMLESYIEDPYTARYLQQKQYGAEDGYTGEWDYDYEQVMGSSTREALDSIAENGKTFFAQELAKGVVSSPLAVIFDQRPEHRYDLVSAKERREYLLNAFREPGVHPEDKKIQVAFGRFTEKLAGAREMPVSDLQDDEKYQSFLGHHNVYNAYGRLWQKAYELPPEASAKLVEPHQFRMRAFGTIDQQSVTPGFYDKFTSQEKIDYDEILEAGIPYAAVSIAPGKIGFFEETGKLIEAYKVSLPVLDAEGYVQPEDIGALIGEVLPNIDDAQKEWVGIVFRKVSGNLEARFVMEQALQSRLDTFSLEEQILLSQLLVRATPEQMRAIVKTGAENIKQAAYALEFGDDYGDSILSIAEKLSSEQASEVFEAVNDFRGQSRQFAHWFEAYDPDFAGAAERAMNERLTDTLAALEVLAIDGKLEANLGPGGRFELGSVDEALEIMRLQQKTMQTIHDVVTDPDVETTRVTEENDQFAMYRFVSREHGQALLYVRPEGAKGYDRRFEYGNRQGVEASISFIANPVDSHAFLSEKDPDGVSIRFDREGRKKDESPFSEDRDPTRKDGSISLDISSILGKSDSPAVRIGKLVAAGNVIRSAKHGGFESLHHNNNHFDQDTYGDAEGFSKLAIYIMHLAEAQIAVQRQGRHHSRFGKLAVTGGQEGAKAAA